MKNILLLLLLTVAPCLAQTGLANLKVVLPTIACADLAHAQIGNDVHITEAVEVPAAKPAPYCKVSGYVEPEVRFEVRLPLKAWTQRFVQTGCGGLCGMLGIHLSNDSSCLPAQNGELVLASTDMGHNGGMDASWAAGHPWRVIDFAYRGVHVTTLATKAIIAAYYGQQPKYSYFAGCSDGGREALMEAQRFPEDFDGITAGAPAMNFITQNTYYHGWNAFMNKDANGQIILTAAQLPILHAAAVKACDALDGLEDGLISDPTACHFNPKTIECKPGQDTSQCLTPAQAAVAQKIYQGAHDAKGHQMVISGPQYGSELAWAGVYIPRGPNDRVMSPDISVGTFRYLSSWQARPSLTLSDLHFDSPDFNKVTALHSLYDATDPDLSHFATLNHKLIIWHGWSDPHISPLNSIAYYEAMQNFMGKQRVQDFARLYLFPGGYHCGGGDGPFNMDLLTPIMQWVESGAAPNQIIASQAKRTRPVFPYPQQAKYTGYGDVNAAASFTATAAPELPARRLEWLGSSFYKPGYETWCIVKDNAATCSHDRH